eukprot:11572948-Alexandrium_andersonii.AAC.1
MCIRDSCRTQWLGGRCRENHWLAGHRKTRWLGECCKLGGRGHNRGRCCAGRTSAAGAPAGRSVAAGAAGTSGWAGAAGTSGWA